MKKLLYLFLLFPIFLLAQPRYGVEGIPMCWTKNGVDSNVIRYVLISSTGSPVQTIAFENAAGQTVNIADGYLRYGYCACSNESSGIPDGAVTWSKLAEAVKDSINKQIVWARLTEAVKDSIRGRKDTTVVVLSENKVVDFDFADTRRYSNVYFVGKGVTDTAQLIFLNPPAPEQFGTVFHMKADSGGVAVRFAGSQGVNNKFLYMLRPGQRAEVRALYDAVAGSELWEVVVVWDSIGGGGNTIYTASDSIRNGDRLVKMASDGSQALGIGNWPGFPDRDYNYNQEFGLYLNRGYGEITLANKKDYITSYDGTWVLVSRFSSSKSGVDIGINGGQTKITWNSYRKANGASSGFNSLQQDTTGWNFTQNVGFPSVTSSYRLPLPAVSSPSTTNATVNILKWTGNGSAAVPGFGTVPNIYNEDGYINSNSRYVQTSGATSKDLFIGYFGQNTTVFNPNITRKNLRGLYISPSYQEGVGLIHMDSSSRNYTNLYMSPYFMSITSSEGTKFNTISIGNNSNSGNSSKIRFSGLNNSSVNYSYAFPTESPATGTGALSALSWNNGSPSFLRSQHAVLSGTTDGSGDITITFPAAMPDASYTLLVSGEGGTLYHYITQPATKATGSVKVRMFTTAGSAAASTAYQISYEVKDN